MLGCCNDWSRWHEKIFRIRRLQSCQHNPKLKSDEDEVFKTGCLHLLKTFLWMILILQPICTNLINIVAVVIQSLFLQISHPQFVPCSFYISKVLNSHTLLVLKVWTYKNAACYISNPHIPYVRCNLKISFIYFKIRKLLQLW